MNKIRWCIWLGLLGALVCVILQLGFYWSANPAAFLNALTALNFASIPIANWIVSKGWPRACFGTRHEVIAFDALVPILSGLQWMLIGLAVDLVRPRADKPRDSRGRN